jgi:Flp pilus assembly protein TadG
MEGLGVTGGEQDMTDNGLRTVTFAALVIVMLANVVAALANWQALEVRQQTQAALAEWHRSASTLQARIEALEASPRATPPQWQQKQQ